MFFLQNMTFFGANANNQHNYRNSDHFNKTNDLLSNNNLKTHIKFETIQINNHIKQTDLGKNTNNDVRGTIISYLVENFDEQKEMINDFKELRANSKYKNKTNKEILSDEKFENMHPSIQKKLIEIDKLNPIPTDENIDQQQSYTTNLSIC